MKSNEYFPLIPNGSYMTIKLPNNLFSEEIRQSFSTLNIDKYMKIGHNYRFRAFIQGVFKENKMTWFDKTDFFQSKKINSYQGGVKREFTAIKKEIRPNIEELLIKLKILNDHFLIGCHQIRITVDDKNVGYPAPEGFHQDGFDHIIIIPVAQNNISGGTTLLRKLDSKEIIYKETVKINEALVVQDSCLEHYTSPITHLIPGNGYRDVFILTITKI